MDVEPFHPRFPWYGPHLQSIRNPLVGRTRLPGGDGLRVSLPLPDGDVLQARYDSPQSEDASKPTVVLVHGLGGCETSRYLLAASACFMRRGHPVYRLSLRGAGPSQATCRDWSHAGRYQDLEATLAQLNAGPAGLVAIGFSLGGCILLNYLARGSVDPRLRAAASVCAPLDLATAAVVLHAPRNWLYQAYLLRALRAQVLNPHAQLDADERARIESARSLFQVDDRFTAPRHGFRDAEHYYRDASPLGRLAAIDRPTLLVHAIDDPFVPAEPYRDAAHGKVSVAMASGGGHLGFHDRQGLWHLRRIHAFFVATLDTAMDRDLAAAHAVG